MEADVLSVCFHISMFFSDLTSTAVEHVFILWRVSPIVLDMCIELTASVTGHPLTFDLSKS